MGRKFGTLTWFEYNLKVARVRWNDSDCMRDYFSWIVSVLACTVGTVMIKEKLRNYDMKLRDEFAKRKLDKYAQGGAYDFKGIKLPGNLSGDQKFSTLYATTKDTFGAWLYNGDDYSHEFVDRFDRHSPEGLYCYKKDDIDITIHEKYTVLDIGAWIGDFSAYCATKGATVYAFEPSKSARKYLEDTIRLNEDKPGEIVIVPIALGNENADVDFAETNEHTATSVPAMSIFEDSSAESYTVRIVKLDDWVRENDVKVDFIKADIEGFEREMLKGATETLKTQQPILSLCTYHLPDDPEVMEQIILKANPNYEIIQRGMKMFAYVRGVV